MYLKLKSPYRASTNLLKNNLLYIVQREENMAQFFEYYKLTTIPASLFKDNGLPKLTKYS